MQRDPRPGDALHVGHGRAAVDVLAMPSALADDAEHAERRRMIPDPRRYGRTCDQRPAVIKRDPLVRDRDDEEEWPLCGVF